MDSHAKRNTFLLCAVCIILFASIILLDQNSYHNSSFDGNTDYPSDEWLFGEKGEELQPVDLASSCRLEPGKTYVLSTTLSYNGDGDPYPCALITTGNFEVKTYLDGILAAHYTKEDRGYPRIQSVGTYCFSIPLGKNCKGRELRIELRSPFTDYAVNRKLPLIRFGDYSAIVHDMFYQNLPNMLISCAIIFNVIVLVLLSNLHIKRHWAYMYFAIFTMFIVIFRGSQDLLTIYLRGTPYMVLFWEHVSIAACLIPLLLSYRYKFDPYYRKTFNWLIGISAANLILQLLLNSFGILDLVILCRLTHAVLLLNVAAILAISILVKKKTDMEHVFLTTLPILAGCVMDIVSFYIRHLLPGKAGFFTPGNFTGFGLTVSLVIMILETRQERIENYQKIEKNKLLERMAYYDALTGLHNRASFDAELEKINAEENNKKSVLCVSADINGLKKVNDSIGHHAGDELICRAAGLLNKCFKSYGTVYRIGGDEFFAFLYNIRESDWKKIQKQMKQELEKDNAQHDVPLNIAIGSMYLGPENIYQTIQYADRNMYINKQKYHSVNA